MRIRRKLLTLLAGLTLSLTMTANVSAFTYSDCIYTVQGYNPTWHVYRNTSTYFAAQGEVVIRQLRGCTNSDQSPNENYYAQVWPANLQGAAGTDFKQVGYGNETSGGSAMNWFGTCCSGFTSNVTGFGLTFYPAIGDTVRFSIYRYAPGGLVYWRLKVDDLSHAGWYGWRDLVQTASSVGEVWYGIEDHSLQSQFGSNSSTNRTRLRGLSYRLSNGGAWTYLTGTTKTDWNEPLGIGEPGCWIETVSTYAGPIDPAQTSLNGYTSDNCS